MFNQIARNRNAGGGNHRVLFTAWMGMQSLPRPGAEGRKRRVDVLVVWALDRLARSLKQLLNIAEECRSLGVDLVSLKQNVDTTLPAGRLTFQVLGAVAEFEREMLRT